ncbi:hypothetical protein HY212_06230 [Candidatus Pacearchaeota archaeon]|nr:hypothetical protein [Candidatus Pacearchaeota archaeon]
MPGNEETVFSSRIRYSGIFTFKDFYQFCYDWLVEESELEIKETKYSEKLVGESKNIEVEWEGTKKITDYFKFKVKVAFKVEGLTKIEMNQEGTKTSTNKGKIDIGIKGILIRDYEGKFEKSAFNKFWRDVYEKWVIPSRIEDLQGKLAGYCDEFLAQAKAWLDLEGRK